MKTKTEVGMKQATQMMISTFYITVMNLRMADMARRPTAII